MRPTPSGAPSKQADANEDLRGLLNAGHQRNRPMLRWDVTSRTAEQLDTFAMALLAGIGDLPDTIMDRAVVIRMRRRAPGEHVDPYRTRRDAPPLHDLRDRLAAWARAAPARTAARHPGDAAGGPGRRHLGTADRHRRPRRRRLAGPRPRRRRHHDRRPRPSRKKTPRPACGCWPTCARSSAPTPRRCTPPPSWRRLHKLEDAPWADWYGHPLSTRDLAKLLRPYQVESKNVREHGTGASLKGYARADLHDAWARYVPPHPLHAPQAVEPAGQAGDGHVADEQPPSATSATGPG